MRVTAEEDGQVNKNSKQAQAPTHKTHVAKPVCRLSKAVYADGGGGFVGGGLGGRDHQKTRQNGGEQILDKQKSQSLCDPTNR